MVLFFDNTLVFQASIDFLMFKIDFRKGRFSQSRGLKIQKFSCPVGPNHGGASLDIEHMGPPNIYFVSMALNI